MNKKITNINMNKVIVLIGAFLVLVVLTIVINNFTVYDNDDKKISSNKNEYASSNNVIINKQNVLKKEEKEIEAKEENKQLIETQPIIEEKQNINTETVLYFENTEEEITTLVDNEDNSISAKVKQKFVELVDFIFYGTKINGVTFNELTEETKQKLMDIVNRIDSKLEEKVPGYKETISSSTKESYAFLVEKLKQGISYLDGKAEEKIGTEKYEEIKENINETKEKVKDTGSVVIEKGKEIISTTKDKIKNWYEGWK